MAGYDREWLDKLLSMTNIVTVVSKYVPLERKGGNYWGRCPFHNEKTPSFSVNESNQFYHCFGCGASGDAIRFVEKLESVEFYDAVKLLAQDARLELPAVSNDKEYIQKKESRDKVIAINRSAAKFYHSVLMGAAGKEALGYLTKRGFGMDTIRRFGLGYSPPDNAVLMHLRSQGYTDEQIKSAGIAEKNQKGYYDVFYGRVIVPIINAFGDVIGFGGRALVKTDFAKYRNTQASEVFDKSNVLFAVNELKKAKQGGGVDYVILAEGYMDVIALHAAGFHTAVASMGTSLTTQQARTISRYAPLVYISYDGDSAGQKAALRGLDILEAAGLEVKVISMPDGLDPDDYIKQFGAAAYTKLLDGAIPLMRYKLTALGDGFDMANIEGRTKFALKAVEEIKKIKDSIEREGSLKILRELTGFTLESLMKQLGTGGVSDNVRTALISDNSDNYEQKAIKIVLWSIINNNGLYKDPEYADVREILNESGIDGIAKKLLDYISGGGAVSGIFREFGEDEQAQAAEIISYGEKNPEHTSDDYIIKYYTDIKIKVLESRQQSLAAQLDRLMGGGGAADEIKALFAKISDTTEQIKKLKAKRTAS